MTIELIKNKDILAEVGKRKKPNQILVGFALETNDEIEHAKSKLERKNLDMIVMNSLRDEGAGFQHLTNKVTILDRNNNIQKFELKTKREVARDIVQYIEDKF
jgi:phosphopantothenoylcysteine decarboxylase/phosphopantothenate--cysteine ligase